MAFNYSNQKKLTTQEQRVMYDLYTMLPPRHSENCELCVWNHKDAEPDNEGNYLDFRNKQNHRILLNHYKGSDKKG